MKLNILLSLILAGSMMSVAHAEEQQSSNTNTVKATEVQKKDEQIKDIDDEITNARMRTTLGSKSKWSFKSAIAYNGGSASRPFADVRPKYRQGTTKPALTSLAGTVGVNYRVNERDSLGFGSGITVNNPFQGDLSKSTFEDPRYSDGTKVGRFQASTPYLSYSRAYKVGVFQMSSGIEYDHATESLYVNESKAFGDLVLSQDALTEFGTSGWTGGLSLSLDYTFYTADPTVKGGAQSDYLIGLYPFAEYSFNDKYSFRTVFGYFEVAHYIQNEKQLGDAANLESQTPYQSMGIGISMTRDIYLYPNIQFTPLDIRSDRTNVALSANINLF